MIFSRTMIWLMKDIQKEILYDVFGLMMHEPIILQMTCLRTWNMWTFSGDLRKELPKIFQPVFFNILYL